MSEEVYLYIYDLSGGLAAGLSQQFLGKKLDGIWHTGIVAYGSEYFYGGCGISFVNPGGTELGEPLKKEKLGVTKITKSEFEGTLEKWGSSNFLPSKYNLFENNCNSFSNEVSKYLIGKEIPSYITSLPADVLKTPLGMLIKPYVDSMTDGIHAREGGSEGHFTGSSNANRAGGGGGGQQQAAASSSKKTNAKVVKSNKKNKNNNCLVDNESVIDSINFSDPLHDDVRMTLTEASSSLVYIDEITSLKLSIESNSPNGMEIPFDAIGLIDMLFTDFVGKDEQVVLLELYRLILWKCPESLMVWLSNETRPIDRLMLRYKDYDQNQITYLMMLTFTKFLTNCVYLSLNWSLSVETELPLSELTTFCLKVIEDLDLRVYGLGLCLNLVLHYSLSEEDAIQLGSYLLHLAPTKKATFQPTAFDNMMNALYHLMCKYPFLVDLAKAQELEILQVDDPICKRILNLMS